MAEQQLVSGGGDFSSKTFLGACNPKYPNIAKGDQLDTTLFLEASKQIIPLVGKRMHGFVN